MGIGRKLVGVGIIGTGAAVGLGMTASLMQSWENQKNFSIENQENFYAVPRSSPLDGSSTDVGGRVIGHTDCVLENGEIIALVSGDSIVEPPESGTITTAFYETTLPNAVSSALGHCDVTVKDATGVTLDQYQVNAYRPAALEYFMQELK